MHKALIKLWLFMMALLIASPVIANDYYGTLQPYAKESIYFLMTDRFVNGDTSNDFQQQGCTINCSWSQKLPGKDAYVGYLGGDFRGILNNIDYIKDMGFSSIWITPIIENPDQAYTGNFGNDHNKSGYHGYWGTNFFKEDEHLISNNLKFKDLVDTLRDQHGIKVVLDIVANHGSHGYGMSNDQYQNSTFGRIFDQQNNKICDHENKPRDQIVGNACFQGNSDGYPYLGVPLAEFDQDKELVVNYLNSSFLYWISQGASAFRIDTVKHVPESYWLNMANTIRAQHPNFYMFGEYFDNDITALSNFQKATTISVLDFSGKEAMLSVFTNPNSSFSQLSNYLDLEFNHYSNPYDLAIFYDNHDMPRMNASDNGFIDAHNWLFTSRGIPVLYYGSEMGFQRGKGEHDGNRNYYGSGNIAIAKNSPIYSNLARIVKIRQANIALQQGLQVNVSLNGHKATFYRVFQHNGVNQTALVLLNKGGNTESFTVNQYLSDGTWVDAETSQTLTASNGNLTTTVPAHGVKVLIRNAAVSNGQLIAELDRIMAKKPDPNKKFAQVYFRGTPNSWAAANEDKMEFQGNNKWTIRRTFKLSDAPGEQMRFKFDIEGDWSHNYGDNEQDGTAERTGADIIVAEEGTYDITFYDNTLKYTVEPAQNCTAPELVLSTSSVNFGILAKDVQSQQTVTLSNGCPNTNLVVNSVTDNQDWITATQNGNTQTVIAIDTTGLTDGQHNGAVSITSNGGNATISVQVIVDNSFAKNFDQVYFRGTPNGWGAGENDKFSLVADHTWTITRSFSPDDEPGAEMRFKIDIFGDWTHNYGDNDQNGALERSGNDILISSAGSYKITFRDDNLTYTVVREGGFNSNFPQVYVRGTNNGWQVTNMELVADNTWQATVSFGSASDERFKFDIEANWAENYGDNEPDLSLDRDGADIPIVNGAGSYTITLNDQTMTYTVSKN